MRTNLTLFFLFISSVVFAATAPVNGTTSFSSAVNNKYYMGTSATSGVASGTVGSNILSSGWDVSGYTDIVGTNDVTLRGRAANPAISTDPYLLFVRASATNRLNYMSLKANDGSSFKLNSINLLMSDDKPTTMSLKIEGYKAGSLVSGASVTQNYSTIFTWATITVSSNSAFQDIDEIRITPLNSDPAGSKSAIGFDEINISNAVSSNLPVTFGNITTRLNSGMLSVQFTTETETNNSHFDIELSKDGQNFTKVTTLSSQHKDGNSSQPTTYNAIINKNAAASYLSVGLLLFGALLLVAFNRKNKIIAFSMVLLAGVGFGVTSCNKTEKELTYDKSSNLFVRIAQVDINGTTSYSKIVKVVAE